MTQAESLARTVEQGTVLQKVIPLRLVEPYLTGRRSVIAGYVYRAGDCAFRSLTDLYHALRLDYEGSEFSPDMPDVYVLRWPALDLGAALAPPPADSCQGWADGPHGPIPEFYTLPTPVPVGAEMRRLTPAGEEFIARYDGQVWLRPAQEV